MKSVSLAEAQAHLSELIELVATGEAVSITRDGQPVAQLVAAEKPRKRITAAELHAVTDGMTMQTESAGDFMRRMRDDARY